MRALHRLPLPRLRRLPPALPGGDHPLPGRKHFDIFPQYSSLFAFVARRPALEAYRKVLFERMVSHYLFCVRRRDRVRPADRRAYFRQAARHYRAHRPPGFRPPRRAARDFGLLARRSYTLFASRELVRRTAGATRRRTRRARGTVGKVGYRGYYALQRRLPLREDLAVYSAYWHRGWPAIRPRSRPRRASWPRT